MFSIELFLAFGIVVVAGLMRGFAGVGSGMLMAPLFALLFGPVDTVAMVIMLELVVTAQLLPGVHGHVNWRVIVPMGLVAAVCMPLGSRLLTALDADLVARIMAGVVLGFAALLVLGWRHEGRKPLPVTLAVGGVSGVLMALTSLGNPPVMLYLLSSRDSAVTNRANFTGYFAITLVALIVQMGAQGLITGLAMKRAAALLPAFMLAAWVGGRLFRRSSERLYRAVAYALLLAAGSYGLLR